MKVYIRKIDYQAVNKQISILNSTVSSFFDNKEKVKIKGITSSFIGEVTILLATDPRLGGDIKQIIKKEGDMEIGDLLIIYKNHANYSLEICKSSTDKYTVLSKMFVKQERHLEIEERGFETDCSLVGYNKIYYGIPGCGKSYHIEHNVLKLADKEHDVFRTTFYLDYSNSDFIGQIYPKVEKDKVTYENVPGPFTKALKRAFEEPNKMIYLVIEEINRGNAAAIFGDVFQLLDRLEEDHDGRVVGDSEYPISNEFIESYLGDLVKKGQVYIPHNLTILATMNTSDQNIFPLDTAFKRRWDRERIVSNWDDCTIKDMCIPFTDISWKNFAETMNNRMILSNDDSEIIVSEDKKLGAYFANRQMLVDKKDRYKDIEENKSKLKKFISNIIDYLYNDVTKFDHNILFKENITYDDIYEIMINYQKDSGDGDLFSKVLKDNIVPDIFDENEDEADE